MAKVKALLVGVPKNMKRQKLDMPSATLDVANVLALLKSLPDLAAGSSCRRLPDPNADPNQRGMDPAHPELFEACQTTKATILYHLENFLFKDAAAGEKLVFYFSGHGLLFTDPNDPTRVDEVLCPSDGDPADLGTNIHADEVVNLGYTALKNGACLEIIIEACSASGFIKQPTQTVYKFGCYFDQPSFPGGSGAVWSASKIWQHSHAGPIPVCSDSDPVGLFTHFFCRGFTGRNRTQLLAEVQAKLDDYALNSTLGCCKGAPNQMGPQNATLFCHGAGLTAQPLTGSCSVSADYSGTDALATVIAVGIGGVRADRTAETGTSSAGILGAGSGRVSAGFGGVAAGGTPSVLFAKKAKTCGMTG